MNVLIAREMRDTGLGGLPPSSTMHPGKYPGSANRITQGDCKFKNISLLAPKYLFTFLSSISPQHRLTVLHQPTLRTQFELSRFFVPPTLSFLGGFAKLKIKFQIKKFKIQITTQLEPQHAHSHTHTHTHAHTKHNTHKTHLT